MPLRMDDKTPSHDADDLRGVGRLGCKTSQVHRGPPETCSLFDLGRSWRYWGRSAWESTGDRIGQSWLATTILILRVSFMTNTITSCGHRAHSPCDCTRGSHKTPRGPEGLWMGSTCPLPSRLLAGSPLFEVTGPDWAPDLRGCLRPLHRPPSGIEVPTPSTLLKLRTLTAQKVNRRSSSRLPETSSPLVHRPLSTQDPSGPLSKGRLHIRAHRPRVFLQEPDRGKTAITLHLPKTEKRLTTNTPDGLKKRTCSVFALMPSFSVSETQLETMPRSWAEAGVLA